MATMKKSTGKSRAKPAGGLEQAYAAVSEMVKKGMRSAEELMGIDPTPKRALAPARRAPAPKVTATRKRKAITR